MVQESRINGRVHTRTVLLLPQTPSHRSTSLVSDISHVGTHLVSGWSSNYRAATDALTDGLGLGLAALLGDGVEQDG